MAHKKNLEQSLGSGFGSLGLIQTPPDEEGGGLSPILLSDIYVGSDIYLVSVIGIRYLLGV